MAVAEVELGLPPHTKALPVVGFITRAVPPGGGRRHTEFPSRYHLHHHASVNILIYYSYQRTGTKGKGMYALCSAWCFGELPVLNSLPAVTCLLILLQAGGKLFAAAAAAVLLFVLRRFCGRQVS